MIWSISVSIEFLVIWTTLECDEVGVCSMLEGQIGLREMSVRIRLSASSQVVSRDSLGDCLGHFPAFDGVVSAHGDGELLIGCIGTRSPFKTATIHLLRSIEEISLSLC